MTFYVEKSLGAKYASSAVSAMEEVYKDTDYKTPLIFILSAGADPLSSIQRLSRELKIPSEKISFISLGQG